MSSKPKLKAKLPSPYLKDPDTIKDQVSEQGQGVFSDITFALSSMQGWRVSQEDAHCHLFPSTFNPNLALVGVFDGHAGGRASAFTAEHILGCIERADSYKFLKDQTKPEIIARSLMEGFFDCDELLRKQTGFKEGTEYSGCTGVVTVFTKTSIIVANSGDSRCVVIRGGADIFSTRDHKPDDPREAARVEKAGGRVVHGRINGDLASARSFGDFRYKTDVNLPPSQQLVTVMPDVAMLDRHPENQLLILGCDGIWDVMSNRECGHFILAALSLGATVQQAADMVLDECLRKSSGDNMSIIIVTLDGLPSPKQKGTPTIDEVRNEMFRSIL